MSVLKRTLKSKIAKPDSKPAKVRKRGNVLTSKYFCGTHESGDDKDCSPVGQKQIAGETEIFNSSVEFSCQRLTFSFYDRPCLSLAKKLIGKVLVRKLASGVRLSGMIVETEAYTGADDIASHSYKGQTDRNKAMFMTAGTAYVYNIYGSYCCMNISSQGEGAAVLLRALQPVEGVDGMNLLRNKKSKGAARDKSFSNKEICNGPSKFCMALDINKTEINCLDLSTSDIIWLEKGIDCSEKDIIVSKRVGIDGAGKEAADKPWRFYLKGNICVSKRDKKAES